MLDLGYIHDILMDAEVNDTYSDEARQSARILREAIHNTYQAGQADRAMSRAHK